MIIVKSEKETVFVNDKNYHAISHDKTDKKVRCAGNNNSISLECVESVRYVNDANPFDFKDEGLELERALKKLSILVQIKDLSHKAVFDIFNFYRVIGLAGLEFENLQKDEIEKVVESFNKVKDKAISAWVNFNKEYDRLNNELKRI